MAVWDERFQGPKPAGPIRNRDQRFTRTDVQDNRIRGNAAPVAVTASDVRTRGQVPKEAPTQQEFIDPDYPNFRMSREEYERHMQRKAERAEQARIAEGERIRQAQIAEDVRKEAETRTRRESWYREQEEARKRGAMKSVTLQDVEASMQSELDALIGK